MFNRDSFLSFVLVFCSVVLCLFASTGRAGEYPDGRTVSDPAVENGRPAQEGPVAAEIQLPPVRAITKGPKFHWFGYYDKLQFDPTGRYVLGMEVDFEGRSPRPDDVIRIGMIDLKADDRWIELGTSSAWSWQQGCMLQWRPGSKSEILYNDRAGDHYVCRILDVFTRRLRTIDHPIYAVSPNGKVAVSADFRRIQDMRQGYGYAGLADPYRDESAPKDSGIFRIDLETGESKLIVSLAEIAKVPYQMNPQDVLRGKHWFNHLLFAPDGKRFIFLNRWRVKTRDGYSGYRTRMFTAAVDGSDIRLVDGYGKTSHFIWRDPEHILAWAWHPSDGNKFYLYEDGTGKVEVVGKGVMKRNGHCTYLPGNEWILNDTYPTGAGRLQNVYLYHVAQNRKVPLGAFHSPKAYTGQWRCDTHVPDRHRRNRRKAIRILLREWKVIGTSTCYRRHRCVGMGRVRPLR